MKQRAIEVRNPPSFVVVTSPDGKRWLNAHRILSMREDKQGTWVEMDNGEAFHVAERAAVIAESVQRPTVTVAIDPPDGEPTERQARR
ncbi:MAG TPA: hypothetical protein VN380_07115 [Thermoanaerobaculia bacterium]|jgi:hypothetical protein|nr:hypothetical protein [Thermoanaerobaculia bacterium]